MRFFPSFKILILLFFFVMISGCGEDKPKRYKFLIPEYFTGTVHIYFGVQEAEPLKMEDGYKLIVVPDDGNVSTCSEYITGNFHDEYRIYTGKKMHPSRRGAMLVANWHDSLGKHGTNMQFNIRKKEENKDMLWSMITDW